MTNWYVIAEKGNKYLGVPNKKVINNLLWYVCLRRHDWRWESLPAPQDD
ncbi:MAG: hypothetical protein SAK29_24380 [Scytonema sp. PMC 1069.18]|nr:hypothetical protein [Scytonema sp. PMC 1069.18]MEC4887214.1 hypothetical protein [Scytonema sp. PMC 1070.18]